MELEVVFLKEHAKKENDTHVVLIRLIFCGQGPDHIKKVQCSKRGIEGSFYSIHYLSDTLHLILESEKCNFIFF